MYANQWVTPEITKAPRHRRPYIRIDRPDGTTIDGQIYGWTDTQVLAFTPHEYDSYLRNLGRYDPTKVHHIPRRDAAWTDPEDDLTWFRQRGEL